MPLQLGPLASVVEPGAALQPEPHAAPDHGDHADQAVHVGDPLAGDRHEVLDLGDAVGADEPREPPRSRSRTLAKMLGESKRGAQNQSIVPSQVTRAAV
ncbi:hypothetical protein GCM10027452_12020 [Micromonospora halotolerans]